MPALRAAERLAADLRSAEGKAWITWEACWHAAKAWRPPGFSGPAASRSLLVRHPDTCNGRISHERARGGAGCGPGAGYTGAPAGTGHELRHASLQASRGAPARATVARMLGGPPRPPRPTSYYPSARLAGRPAFPPARAPRPAPPRRAGFGWRERKAAFDEARLVENRVERLVCDADPGAAEKRILQRLAASRLEVVAPKSRGSGDAQVERVGGRQSGGAAMAGVGAGAGGGLECGELRRALRGASRIGVGGRCA